MFDLAITIESPDPILTVSSVYNSSPFKDELPDEFMVDDVEKKITKKWIDKYVSTCKYSVSLLWGEWGDMTLFYKKDGALGFSITNFWNTVEEITHFLQSLPWTVATLVSVHDSWFGQEIDYAAPGFAYRHGPLGWGCAFKGEGHKRVVSRRYLEYGPWHVIRDEANDITLIQFHDLDADPLTALEQAKPGHQLMGEPFEGGFIQRDYQLANPNLSGIYTADEKMFRIVVADRPIPRTELLDVCAIRLWQLLGEDQPVERVAYVFTMGEEEARQNLHELWLREIECWTYVDHVLTRIDEDYTPPPPEKPEWIKQLEAQENNTAT
jgi:hypothetical protein